MSTHYYTSPPLYSVNTSRHHHHQDRVSPRRHAHDLDACHHSSQHFHSSPLRESPQRHKRPQLRSIQTTMPDRTTSPPLYSLDDRFHHASSSPHHATHDTLPSSPLLPPCDLAGRARPSPWFPAPTAFDLDAHLHSLHFPAGHMLNPHFVDAYQLGDELGTGGYGFVMTARHREEGHEVAVKFIIKAKVPEDAWMEHEDVGRVPSEIMLLSFVKHGNIVQCFDVFEDGLYFYLVQELHGSPWPRVTKRQRAIHHHGPPSTPDSSSSPPFLSPCVSEDSLAESEPETPPQECVQLHPQDALHNKQHVLVTTQEQQQQQYYTPHYHHIHHPELDQLPKIRPQPYLRPNPSSRPSHDLFECIEQAPHKRLSESQARHIFAQVVEAVYYLDMHGITHRDIKDENLVIDKNLKVKLIDFGSAVIADPTKPRPYYAAFCGTSAYASSEILRKVPYQAPPAEIWTLGILMSFLLTGASPFLSANDAIAGRIVLSPAGGDPRVMRLSGAAVDLMRRCLVPDPKMRADIREVRAHVWLCGALSAS